MPAGPMRSRVFGCLLVCASFACGDRGGDVVASAEKRGAPPPPAATTGPGGCRAAIEEQVAKPFCPGKVAGFCLDPGEPGRAMGKESSEPLEKMCDLFDGECAVYESFGVERVVRTVVRIDEQRCTSESQVDADLVLASRVR